MTFNILSPRKALNKAYLKVKPDRTSVENFKANLIQMLDHMDDIQREDQYKILLIDFLKKTYFDPLHHVNSKGDNDLVIHNGNRAKTTVGVIIETKRPSNKAEMLKPFVTADSDASKLAKINVKAFQELVLYYLRERITHKNLEVKHLVATNINEWFIFDANTFDRLFAQNKSFVHQFTEFEAGRMAEHKTDFFYKQIAEPFIASITSEISFTYFNLKDYDAPLRNEDKADDHKLIALFKLLSPEHLLNKAFVNDSNSLDKRFYSELLHIIGLTENKVGGKKLIQRQPDTSRNTGSILEDAIIQLDSLDKINRLDRPSQYGATMDEKLFTVALELSITWINRILFLKLLEAQLITYHKGDTSYAFLNHDKIRNYDDLNSLFFQVLAKKQAERNDDVNLLFAKVPYLNSSLFEPTEMEQVTLLISNLKDDKTIPIIAGTVLKDDNGRKRTGKLTTLQYLFEFLNAYDFASEGSEAIQEDNKTLINASVLGLIFEKINGYKDGSFFTPGFITMYMCRETIRRAVVQKFNEVKGWNCTEFGELYNKIEDRNEANTIVNSLKIVDPAVGSGHFLVSALNEIIAVKNDLRILQDRKGDRLKEYEVSVVNDELFVTDDNNTNFVYNPKSKESQRIQETLFHEKHTIIENCLFGVDINPNSVKICRLRLWIELLKNAYYKNATELETLPNIDINIKCGNSLVSRFAIDADLRQALKKSKWTMDSYRVAVDTYRNAQNKDQKREMERLMASIKSDFRSEISSNDPKAKKLYKLSGELLAMSTQQQLFDMGAKEKATWNKKLAQLTTETKTLEAEIEDIRANKIYENAFEWRFEFPEVLNDDGDFVGFDVVIGNPPYGVNFMDSEKAYIKEHYTSYQYKFESYIYFTEHGLKILQKKGILDYITPTLWLTLETNFKMREQLLIKYNLRRIFIHGENVFDEAVVNTCSFQVIKEDAHDELQIVLADQVVQHQKSKWIDNKLLQIEYRLSPKVKELIESVKLKSTTLLNFGDVIQGITPYDSYRGHSTELIKSRAFHHDSKIDETCGMWLDGKDLNRYTIDWKENWFSYGEWVAAPREKRFFVGKRILFREVPGSGKRIQACITSDEFYYGHSISPFKPFEDYQKQVEYILGIVNSKLMSWIGKQILPNFGKDVFPKLNPNDIKELLIPTNLESSQIITNIVTEIIETKKQNPQADTTALEVQIDQLVYELYGLSEEEIGIVEG